MEKTPFATLHTLSDTAKVHPAHPQILAAAALNNLTLTIPPNFEFGKTNKTPSYLSKFPLGKIPALETPSGFRITEANAIAYYLCESGPKKELLLGSTAEERATVLQWTSFTTAHLQASALELVRPILGIKAYDEKVHENGLRDFKRWMEYLEGCLAGRTWILEGKTLEDGLSLADLTVAQGLRLVLKFYLAEEERAKYPGIMAWWNRVLAVPEVEKVFGGNVLLQKKAE